ncbi:MAG TPA: DUF2334 domain-containing protein [Candidatus Acidoferrum sp.]|nr:DUF2334 domain-containing protein [Candidatus Acidoferrum sp.]
MKSQYLLRFDDLCPTMNWGVWEEVEHALLEFRIKPILAVVPDNRDPKLNVGPARDGFWDTVRRWQSRGWTIGLHGYQHIYVINNAGLARINRRSEFSGLPYSAQLSKLRAAIAIFRNEGVQPEVWVAPAHSFDLLTVKALEEVGIRCISDGFYLHPHRDRSGMFWIPQQLWRFRRMPMGVWTVCQHINHWSSGDVTRFRGNLRRFAESFTDYASVLATYQNRRKNSIDSLYSHAHRLGVRSRQLWLSTQEHP